MISWSHKGTAFWYKQHVHLTTNKAWYVAVFWKVFSQESSEGRITQALGLNVVADWQCCINGCISALSKKICKMLRSFHCSLKNPFLSLSPLASVSQSTCRGQNTFNSPEVSTKKKKKSTQTTLWFGWEQFVKTQCFLWSGNAAFWSCLLLMRRMMGCYLLCVALPRWV